MKHSFSFLLIITIKLNGKLVRMRRWRLIYTQAEWIEIKNKEIKHHRYLDCLFYSSTLDAMHSLRSKKWMHTNGKCIFHLWLTNVSAKWLKCTLVQCSVDALVHLNSHFNGILKCFKAENIYWFLFMDMSTRQCDCSMWST